MKKSKKKILITDWHILPQWGKGLAIGAIIGSILMIPGAFLTSINPNFVYIPFLLFVISCIIGFLISKKK